MRRYCCYKNPIIEYVDVDAEAGFTQTYEDGGSLEM